MNKKSQYKAFEIQIIVGITLILLTGILIIKDKGITGYATREIPKTIEINQTEILTPQQITEEKPTQIQQTIEEKPIETQEDCIVPYKFMNVSGSIVLCNGIYYFNLTDSEYIFNISNSNWSIDFNGSVLIGNGSGDVFKDANSADPVYSNITIINGRSENFRNTIIITSFNNIIIRNFVIWNNSNTHAYLGRVNNVLIENLTSCYNRYSHGLYIDALLPPGSSNITIRNSLFCNNSGNGAKDNSANVAYVTNLMFYNNILEGNACNRSLSAYDSEGCNNCSYFNNIFKNNKQGISIYSNNNNGLFPTTNSSIFNNTFLNNRVCGSFFDVAIFKGSNNNKIYNNTYLDSKIYFIGGTSIIDNNTNNLVEENTTQEIIMWFAYPTTIKFNYSGIKKFNTMTNGSILYGQYPNNDIKNVSNGVILALNVNNYTITLEPNQTIEVGNFVEDVVDNSVPVVDSIILLDNLTCMVNASDADNDSLNYIIEWYYNNTLNKTSNNSVDVQELFIGEHYCRARVYDGFNYSEWNYSNTIIIYPNNSINLSNSLNCYGYINNTYNLTFYLNNNPNFTIEVNGSFNVSLNISEGLWYCSIGSLNSNNVSITINTPTIVNTPVNTAPKTTSGGSGFIAIPNINTSNLSNNSNLNNNSNLSNINNITLSNYSNNISSNNSLTFDQSVNIDEMPVNKKTSEPIIESPDIVGKAYLSINKNYSIVGFIILFLIIVFIAYKNKPVYNPNIESFTVKALNSGYSYNAIRHVLRRYYPEHVIDDHFHILRRKNYKTLKQSLKNISLTQKNIIILNNYILRQRNNGFKDKDIKTALKNFGYPKELIDASFNYKNN